MLDGQLDTAEYRKIKSKLEPEIDRLEAKVSTLSSNSTNEKDVIEFGLYFLNNIDEVFTEADLDKKRYLLGSTFPEKLVYKDGTYRTTTDDNVLILLANTGKGLGEKKEGRRDLFRLPSRKVVSPGIEPRSKV